MLTLLALYGSYMSLRLYFLPSLPAPSMPKLLESYVVTLLTGSLEFFSLAAFFFISLLPPLYLSQNYSTFDFYNHPPSFMGVPVSGLLTGLGSVAYSQLVVVAYHWCNLRWGGGEYIQEGYGLKEYDFVKAMVGHFSNLEGVVLLGLYLSVYWISGCMPPSFYTFEGGIPWLSVLGSLALTDLLQYGAHRVEHLVPSLYKGTHKPHHVHKSPVLFDAFSGSLGDTYFMILNPLFTTSRLIRMNVWGYMVFGAIYSSTLCLIHSEKEHPWEPTLGRLGFGTARKHHYHHRRFDGEYGHLFAWWDMLFGTSGKKNPPPGGSWGWGDAYAAAADGVASKRGKVHEEEKKEA
mmetsp:Transcript_7534/g.15698  ORF Transcript_7534/g.15698 Transcript_7534/m.15698 type:complete len:348 (-) Transcript_7534:107-1150(-)